MKLNPPDSSSDLARARTVARRLHDRALRKGGPDTPPTGEASLAAAPGTRGPISPTRSTPPPASGPQGFEPENGEPPELELTDPAPANEAAPGKTRPTRGTEPPARAVETSQPEIPPVDTPVFEPPAFEPPAFEPPAFEPPVFEPPSFEPPALEPAELEFPAFEGPDETSTPPAEEPEGPSPDTGAWRPEPEDAADRLTGEAVLEDLEPPDDPYAEPPAVSPEDLLGAGPALDPRLETPLGGVDAPSVDLATDDILASPAPSWEDIADSCLALAAAHGTMLVDPAGQVLTARGEWPEPGPDAIAGRLVKMMDRTLQDAPTRSVSAPIAGQHLTAWRIPSSDGFLTVVFMGEAPLSTHVRPTIDQHILQSLTA